MPEDTDFLHFTTAVTVFFREHIYKCCILRNNSVTIWKNNYLPSQMIRISHLPTLNSHSVLVKSFLGHYEHKFFPFKKLFFDYI